MLKETKPSISNHIIEDKEKVNLFFHKIKHLYFDLLTLIIKYYSITVNAKLFIIIIEALQLLSYPLNTNFSYIWDNTPIYHFISTLLSYCQITSLFKGNINTYLFSFYFIIVVVILTIILLFFIGFQMKKSSFPNLYLIKVLSIIMPLLITVFYIPIVNILISIYHCNSGTLLYASNQQCWTVPHFIHLCIGSICLIAFMIFSCIVTNTFYEFKNKEHSSIAKREVYIENVLAMAKTFLCITFTFITEYNFVRIFSIINTFIFLYISYYMTNFSFLFYSSKIQKAYQILSYATSWGLISLTIGSIGTKGKETIKDNLFIYIFIVGEIIIIVFMCLLEKKFTYAKMTRPLSYAKSAEELIELIEQIVYLSINREKNRSYQILLNGYMQYTVDNSASFSADHHQIKKYYNGKTINKSAFLFFFLQIKSIYQYAIQKFPLNASINIHYAIFLYKYFSRKDQALIQISSITRCNLTLSQEFIVYQLLKSIEGSTTESNGIDLFANLSYIGMTAKFKALIIKASLLYIDFWSLLTCRDQENQEEFSKLNNIGTKINDIVETIHNVFTKMQKIRPHDNEIIMQYSQFTSEVLNDKKTSDEYKSHLCEMGTETDDIIDEDNLCNLDLNKVVCHDEYQCIIYSAMIETIGAITHISLALCGMLGYTKEELIGKHIEVLLPESYAKPHRNYIINLTQEYKKKLMNDFNHIDTFKINFREMFIFLQNKLRYLIPLNIKFAFFPNENSTQYFIMRLINEKNSSSFTTAQCSCYVLTNANLIIQNLTANAISLLDIQSHQMKEITENIKQFNEDYLKYILDNENEDDVELIHSKKQFEYMKTNANKKKEMLNCDYRIKIKQELLKKKYFKPIAIKWTKGNNFRRGKNENNFVLTASEVNEFGKFIGFLFKFQPIWIHNRKSESGVVFHFDQNIDKNFIPQKGKQFLIATDSPAFIQQDKVDVIKMRRELRKKAEDKFLVKKENDSQCSSSSYDTSSYEESEDQSLDSREVSESQSSQDTPTLKNQIEVKRKIVYEVNDEDNYYHVNMSKIKLYIYNFRKRILIEEDISNVQSQVDEKIGEEVINLRNQHWGKTREKQFTNKTKRTSSIRKKQKTPNEEKALESSTLQEEILKKEIDKALKRNDSSKSIWLLHLLSIFSLLIMIIKGILFIFLIVHCVTIVSDIITLLERSYDQFVYLIMSQYHVRELTLLNIKEYTSIIGQREESFQEHITAINDLFSKINQIHQDLITYHVQFDKNEAEYLESIASNMSYITKEGTLGNMINRYKTITNSINIALYHIMNLTIDDMYTTNKDIFFFLYNSFNSIYIGHSKSIDLSQQMVVDSFKKQRANIIVIYVFTEIMIIFSFFVMQLGLIEISKKKNSYLTVFFKIGKKVILKSLAKCEKFTLIQQNENKNKYNSADDVFSDLSSFTETIEIDNLSPTLVNNTESNKLNDKKKKKNHNYSTDILIANRKFFFLLVFVFVCDTICIIIAIIWYNLIKDSIQIYHSETILQKKAISSFNIMREFIVDKNAMFRGEYIKDIMPTLFNETYFTIQSEKMKIRNSVPQLSSYFFNHYYQINAESICSYGENELNYYYPNETCDQFTGYSASLGLDKLLMYFFEGLRTLKGFVNIFHEKEEKSEFKYNYTVYGTKYFNDYLPQDENKISEYYMNSPLTLLNTSLAMKLSFYLRFFIQPAFSNLISNIMIGVRNICDKIKKLIYLGAYCLNGLIIVLYFIYWIPFIRKLDTAIYKTKNMLTIIPRDVLASVLDIQKLLDINTNFDQISMRPNKKRISNYD